MVWVFWVSVGLLVHTYFLYPVVLVLLDAGRKAFSRPGPAGQARALSRVRAPPVTVLPVTVPKVTVIVAAHNEERCIGAKVENSLALDYPPGALEILIGSDGSTDRTHEIVAGCRDPRVRLSAAARGGKVAVLNRCIPQASGEVVVLTDANTDIDPQAIARLVAHFQDPSVGAVCGRLHLYNPSNPAYEESAYWRYESALKSYEGGMGAVLGANGALYAIRRSLFVPLRPDTIVDDFVIPMRILQQGYRVVYEPAAIAREETTEDYGQESSRRARIAAGNFQSLRDLGPMLLPVAGGLFVPFAFWSHKLLRWVAPLLMASAFLSNALLLSRGWAWVALAGQLGFYGLALAARSGARLPPALRRAASVAYYFASMNWALAVGFWRFARKSQPAAWQPTARAA